VNLVIVPNFLFIFLVLLSFPLNFKLKLLEYGVGIIIYTSNMVKNVTLKHFIKDSTVYNNIKQE